MTKYAANLEEATNPNNPYLVKVTFDNTAENYELVITNCNEDMHIEYEDDDSFCVVYSNSEEFNNALERYQDEIEDFQIG